MFKYIDKSNSWSGNAVAMKNLNYRMSTSQTGTIYCFHMLWSPGSPTGGKCMKTAVSIQGGACFNKVLVTLISLDHVSSRVKLNQWRVLNFGLDISRNCTENPCSFLGLQCIIFIRFFKERVTQENLLPIFLPLQHFDFPWDISQRRKLSWLYKYSQLEEAFFGYLFVLVL